MAYVAHIWKFGFSNKTKSYKGAISSHLPSVMQNKRFPCEIAVWRILPTIRSKIAKQLASLGLPQMVISKRLGITQPAVSQYVTKKRGMTFAVSDEAQTLIQSLAEDVARGKDLNPVSYTHLRAHETP